MGNLILNPQYLAGFDIGRFFQDLYMNSGQYFYDAFIVENRHKHAASGSGNTLLITLFAVIIGIVLGTPVALTRAAHNSDKKKFHFLNVIYSIYLTVIRGTPAVVQLLITYYVTHQSADKMAAAVVAFGINSGAHVAEVIRSGIQSVDKGQIEAGHSLGLNQKTTMIKIVFPQVLKDVAPTIFDELISLLEETSVAGYIGMQDLTKAGDVIRSITYNAYTPLLTVAAVYLLIVMILIGSLTVLERRLSVSDIR